ncbi:hypothetical protein [Solibacillus ferritrahens]|uniref:Uncharacterized protein n=2 Tax=Solibacillus merdavium TaxID=2762218 RepID=A0ABR8XL38_9BACL|nr:hypothetical protein [Solibacillus merdavium]
MTNIHHKVSIMYGVVANKYGRLTNIDRKMSNKNKPVQPLEDGITNNQG